MAKVTLPMSFITFKENGQKYEIVDKLARQKIDQIPSGGQIVSGVTSINGETGTVTITAKKLGALTEQDLDGKVDKVAGKGLSENDYTDAEKSKLSGIEEEAQKNTVYSVNGRTGDVRVDANDVGAVPIDFYIPEDGYTMIEPPDFEDGYCIYSEYGTNEIGSIGAGNSLSASDYIPVRGKNTLFISFPIYHTDVPPASGLVFYDKNKNALKNYGTNCLWGGGSSDPFAQTVEVFVPAGAKYFRTTWWSSDMLSRHPEIDEFTYTFTPGRLSDHAITSEMPANRGMMNAIRRTRQLTDIRWTPRVNVPRYSSMAGTNASTNVVFLDWCESGKEYTGIPYSGSGGPKTLATAGDAANWGYHRFWVGLDVPIDSFVTAARYPNSIFGERANRSSVNYDGSIYGDVCSSLLFYSLGLTGQIWPISDFMTNANYGQKYFTRVGSLSESMSVSDLRLGDVFYSSTHVAIITDLFRDIHGNITAVEISEATPVGNPSNGASNHENLGGMARRKTWNVNVLINSYFSRYGVWRYKNFTAIDYTPSDFVDTGREGNGMPIVDYPCIPYLGNKAKYKVGYIFNSKILVGATGFSTLVVLKDGEEFNRINIVSNQTEYTGGFSAAGSYEAYLEDGSGNRTISCEWTVE